MWKLPIANNFGITFRCEFYANVVDNTQKKKQKISRLNIPAVIVTAAS